MEKFGNMDIEKLNEMDMEQFSEQDSMNECIVCSNSNPASLHARFYNI